MDVWAFRHRHRLPTGKLQGNPCSFLVETPRAFRPRNHIPTSRLCSLLVEESLRLSAQKPHYGYPRISMDAWAFRPRHRFPTRKLQGNPCSFLVESPQTLRPRNHIPTSRLCSLLVEESLRLSAQTPHSYQQALRAKPAGSGFPGHFGPIKNHFPAEKTLQSLRQGVPRLQEPGHHIPTRKLGCLLVRSSLGISAQ